MSETAIFVPWRALIVGACTAVAVGGASAHSQDRYASRTVALGATAAVEDLSDIGQNVVALADGGWAAVWVAVETDPAGVAVSGKSLLQLLDPDGEPILGTPVVLTRSDTGSVHSPAVVAGDGGSLYAASVVQGAFVPGPGYPFELVVQRVDAAGRLIWPGGGVIVSVRDTELPVLVPADRGGVLVCFGDRRGSEERDVFCQKLDPDGAWTWAFEGVRVGADAVGRFGHVAVSDKAGGAIVAWLEPASGQLQVRLQRIDQDAARLWGDRGVLVAETGIPAGGTTGLRGLGAIADGRGGVVLAYERAAASPERDREVVVERFGRDGLPAWWAPAVVGAADERSRRHEATVTNGFGDAFVVTTAVMDGSDGSCRVTRVTAEGELPWGSSGVELAGSGCDSGRAAWGAGELAAVAAVRGQGRAFLLRPDGSRDGPHRGHVVDVGANARPADAALSTQEPRLLSLWEQPSPDRPGDVDVVGEVRELVPRPPRRPSGRTRRGGP